ncbi:DNA-binding transcriptional regulator, MarR family [Blastococcus mobilis]|uniref:DNA-binding transcriptional regulator, MarR family n=1 Tax=Blastococcus mobilis TaxID=1938746 RepID=A0A238Y8M9_9ACTN|nr:DNA-binding transcriptional regulator, MarR family [Blastococcus mobilis]
MRLGRSEDCRLTMGSLAEQISLTTGGVTRLIDRMESAGYVQRVPCPTDRRVSYAALTDTGRAKLDEAAPVHAANLCSVFAAFSDEERDMLDALLDRLRAAPEPGRAAGR